MSSSAPRTIPRGQRAHRRRQTGAHPLLRPPPDRVEHSRHAVTSAAGQPRTVGMEHRPDARPPQVGDVVEAPARALRSRKAAARPDLLADRHARERRAPRSHLDALLERRPRPPRTVSVCGRLHAHAARTVRDPLAPDHVADQLDVSPRLLQQPRVVDRGESRGAGQRAGGHQRGDGQDADRRRAGPQGREGDGAGSTRRRLRREPSRQARSRSPGRRAPSAAGGRPAPPASHAHLVLQRLEALRADAADLLQVLDGPEAAVLLAPVEDLLGRRRARCPRAGRAARPSRCSG